MGSYGVFSIIWLIFVVIKKLGHYKWQFEDLHASVLLKIFFLMRDALIWRDRFNIARVQPCRLLSECYTLKFFK